MYRFLAIAQRCFDEIADVTASADWRSPLADISEESRSHSLVSFVPIRIFDGKMNKRIILLLAVAMMADGNDGAQVKERFADLRNVKPIRAALLTLVSFMMIIDAFLASLLMIICSSFRRSLVMRMQLVIT